MYPWGTEWKIEDVPTVDKGRTMLPPADVSADPGGASSFGVQDLVGNVWQWTDEFMMSIRGLRSYAAAVTINPRDHAGIFRKRISYPSMENIF